MFGNDWNYNANVNTFENIDLSSVKNKRFWTVLNCIIFLWGLSILKFLLFASDIYTCIKLLAFNSWSNNIIQPYLPFRISKWLFSSCILASVVLLFWEFVGGIKVYRTRNISLTYVNNFSRTAYSIRDYSKYCVYFRLTPKGKFQKIAFFTFFELKNCLRLLIADTPRQIINGLTLWSVLITVDNENSNIAHGHLESFSGLISKIKMIAKTNHAEAVLLSFMLFSFVVWAIFISKLIVAMVLSVYVYYKIIQGEEYGGLREFVCITVNRRVEILIEKQRTKKDLISGPYRLAKISKSSIFDEDEAKTTTFAASIETLPTTIYDDSTVALMESKEASNNRGVMPGLVKISTSGSLDTRDEKEVSRFREPLKETSIIYGDNNYSDNIDGARIIMFDVAKHLKAPRFNASTIHSSDSLPLSETLINHGGHPKDSNELEYSSRRMKPPPLLPGMHAVKSEYRHIYTPIRAYTREIERSKKFPNRYDGLLERREKMANEDYSHYVNRHADAMELYRV